MFDIDLNKYRVLDLSCEVIPGEQGDRPFIIELGYLADNAYKYDIKTHSHVGTHIETPLHFFGHGKSITDFPLTTFMGRAILAPVKLEGEDFEVTPDYLEKTIGDTIKEGDIVVCRNDGDVSKKPYFTPRVAEWFREHKIKMLVFDHFGLGEDVSEGRKFHDILMSEDVVFLEIPDNLNQLQQREFYFMALPFKVRGLDSSWVRAIAIEEK